MSPPLSPAAPHLPPGREFFGVPPAVLACPVQGLGIPEMLRFQPPDTAPAGAAVVLINFDFDASVQAPTHIAATGTCAMRLHQMVVCSSPPCYAVTGDIRGCS